MKKMYRINMHSKLAIGCCILVLALFTPNLGLAAEAWENTQWTNSMVAVTQRVAVTVSGLTRLLNHNIPREQPLVCRVDLTPCDARIPKIQLADDNVLSPIDVPFSAIELIKLYATLMLDDDAHCILDYDVDGTGVTFKDPRRGCLLVFAEGQASWVSPAIYRNFDRRISVTRGNHRILRLLARISDEVGVEVTVSLSLAEAVSHTAVDLKAGTYTAVELLKTTVIALRETLKKELVLAAPASPVQFSKVDRTGRSMMIIEKTKDSPELDRGLMEAIKSLGYPIFFEPSIGSYWGIGDDGWWLSISWNSGLEPVRRIWGGPGPTPVKPGSTGRDK
jgi:hypothetical protein